MSFQAPVDYKLFTQCTLLSEKQVPLRCSYFRLLALEKQCIIERYLSKFYRDNLFHFLYEFKLVQGLCFLYQDRDRYTYLRVYQLQGITKKDISYE